MDLKEFLSHLDGVKGSGNQYSARCPAHEDRTASLSVSTGADGKILMKCHAGCEVRDIVAALGMEEKDLFPPTSAAVDFVRASPAAPAPPSGQWQEVAHYDYTDKQGGFLFRKIRWQTPQGKSFTWKHQEGGAWVKGRGKHPPVLYNLKAVAGADEVYLVEGEKDVETLRALGLVATSPPDGASSKWLEQYTRALEGKSVYIIQDNDEPGKAFAQKAAGALLGAAKCVKVIDLTKEWETLPEHGDATDAYQRAPDGFTLKLGALVAITSDFSPQNIDSGVVCIDEIKEKEVDWLVPGYIPKGGIVTIGADGGAGKSFVWCALIAAISSGKMPFILDKDDYRRFDGYRAEPQTTLFFSAEDDLETTLKKRLRINGANMKKILSIGLENQKLQEISFDSPYLRELIRVYRPALVVFDPIQAFVGKVNMIARNEMRQVMEPLIQLGKTYGCAFLIICHTNKRMGVFGRQRLADSSDVWDISRSVFLAGNTKEEGVRYLSHEKSNYGRLGRTVLFAIEGEGVVVNKGFTEKKDYDFMTEPSRKRETPAKEAAEDFLLDFLADGKEHSAKEINEAAEEKDFSKTTLKNVRAQLVNNGVLCVRKESQGKGSGVTYFYKLEDDCGGQPADMVI